MLPYVAPLDVSPEPPANKSAVHVMHEGSNTGGRPRRWWLPPSRVKATRGRQRDDRGKEVWRTIPQEVSSYAFLCREQKFEFPSHGRPCSRTFTLLPLEFIMHTRWNLIRESPVWITQRRERRKKKDHSYLRTSVSKILVTPSNRVIFYRRRVLTALTWKVWDNNVGATLAGSGLQSSRETRASKGGAATTPRQVFPYSTAAKCPRITLA